MKTIEERANDYISKVTGCECEELAGFISHRYFKGKKTSIKKSWNDIDAWEAYIAGATEQKAIDKEATLKGFTTDELRAELKRRAAEEKAKKESVLRCRMCKHWGAIDYWGNPINYTVGNSHSCKFFKTKEGKCYKRHRASRPACEHFERKEE